MKIAIRADADPQIGTGHVMRCLALAQALQRVGHEVSLIGHINVPWLKKRLGEEQLAVCYLDGAVPSAQDPAILLNELQGYEQQWVVLDGYHFSYACQQAVKDAGYRLLVIDDYNHLNAYCCDILLNQNIDAETYAYQGNIGRKLLGLQYVLLRQDIIDAIFEVKQKKQSEKIANVLLTLGGGDVSHMLQELSTLFHSAIWEGITLRVVTGGTSLATWNKLLKDCPASIELLGYVHDMPRQMLWADFCISAGGSTCWELCALNVPFAVLAVAENQKAIATALISKGYSCSVDNLKDSLQLPKDAVYLKYEGNLLTDIIGSYPYLLDRATPEDCEGVYAIANDPQVRAVSLSLETIPYENHVQWFKKRIARPLPFMVLKDVNGDVHGYARFENDGEKIFVSIALSKDARGRSLGKCLLRAAVATYVKEVCCESKIWAFIRHENVASKRLFTSCNFIKSPFGQSDRRGEYYFFTY